MRIALTGATGRLGRALVSELRSIGDVRTWSRPEYDLDDPDAASRIRTDAPDLVVHSAAWTDVDACARHEDLAIRRNAQAVAELALACRTAGSRLVLVSTNEVFDGDLVGKGYRPEDPVGPRNPYGASKLSGERAAQYAFAERPEALLIVRTAWLYGPPGNDFPAKIVAAAQRARDEGRPLLLVRDETGSPSATADVAWGIAQLIGRQAYGIRHVVNSGQATRAEWATEVLRVADIAVATQLVPASTWRRDSTPPAWGVLTSDVHLRSWQEATRDYVAASLVAAAHG
jgi:dTDP-4-dehydrorhamnose reductase